jgi:polysaccharide export outer membrane protein
MTTKIVCLGRRRLVPLGRSYVVAIGLVCSVMVLAACAINPQPQPESLQSGTYEIGPPDKLEIIVDPEPVISRLVTVRPDGRISFDLIGDVDVTGFTPSEVAQEIQSRIIRFKREARVSVFVSLSGTESVTIFGEVRSPGVFPLVRDTRLAEAIGLRGGPTTFARKGKVRVIRVVDDQTEVHMADLGAIMRGDLTTNIMLAKGDIIVVPPNLLARIGYAIQNILFPFTPLISPTIAVAGAGI